MAKLGSVETRLATSEMVPSDTRIVKAEIKSIPKSTKNNQSQDWETFKLLDRKLKREAKTLKEKRMLHKFREISGASVTEASRDVAQMMREKEHLRTARRPQRHNQDL